MVLRLSVVEGLVVFAAPSAQHFGEAQEAVCPAAAMLVVDAAVVVVAEL